MFQLKSSYVSRIVIMLHQSRFQKLTLKQIFRKILLVMPVSQILTNGNEMSGWWRSYWLRHFVLISAVLVVLPAFYYGILPPFLQKIDDSPMVSLVNEPNKSQVVSVIAAVIKREVETYGWTPNDPFFYPTYALDNMPNYQLGILSSISRFTMDMSDQIGRMRGSSQIDPDLDNAVDKLKYSGKIWVVDFKTSFMPVTPSEDQYKLAWQALQSYNRRVAMGNAIFEKRPDVLQVILNRINLHLASVSAMLDEHIRQSDFLPYDRRADDIFYHVKGMLYAYSLIIKALQHDFDKIISDWDLITTWQNLVTSLDMAAALSCLIITNGAPDGLLFPNHLLTQGFYLFRVRTQLGELTSILQK